jgi:RNA polymerase sigma factor (sigma-70 family)
LSGGGPERPSKKNRAIQAVAGNILGSAARWRTEDSLAMTTLIKTARGHLDRLFTAGSFVGVADGQLLERFLSHRDEDAFAMLVERHAPMVMAVCRRSLKNPGEVDDAFQATFLILARRPGPVRGRDSLGGWLNGVARRVCLLANRAAARRRRHERRAAELRAVEAVIDMAHDDRWPEIYDEIDRLPANFRLPVVLCVLEGRTRAEAAAQLGWTEGSVRGRLGRAKDLLRSRLVRRGFEPAVALAALLHERASAEIVPRALIERTAYSAVRAAAGMVSASTAALCREVLRTMLMTKLKLGAVAMLAAGGIGWGLAGVTATQDQQPKVRSSPAAGARPAESRLPSATQTALQPSSGAMVTVRVLDPDGKPVASANVYRCYPEPDRINDFRKRYAPGTKGAVLLPRAGPDGSFRLSPEDTKAAQDGLAQLVAMAEGFGPAFAEPVGGDAAPVFRLARDDVPIRGRVIDIQGRPVAGATIQVVGILRPRSGTLDEWLDALKRERAAYPAQSRTLRSWSGDDIPALFPTVVADREGRFTLKGIGRERIAVLLVGGPGIETLFEYAATRDMPAVKVPRHEQQHVPEPELVYHGAALDLAAGPGLEIVGTVRDKDTRKPLAGVTVQTTMPFGNPFRYFKTTTDARGDYRLSGLPLKDTSLGGQEILAVAKEGPPYVPSLQDLDDAPGPASLRKDFTLSRGTWARGRVIDRSTGRPVFAELNYFIFVDNPHLKDYPGYGTLRFLRPFHTDENGAFQIAVIPGRGILGAWAAGPYRIGAGLENIKGRDSRGLEVVNARPSQLIPANFNTLIEIDPRPGEESITVDIGLDRGRTLKGKLVGPDGEPVAGALMLGAEDYYQRWSERPLASAEFEVNALGTQRKRGLLFYHEAKQLAGAYLIKPDEAGPLTVKLEPCGALTGRLVDRGGLPQAGARLTCDRPILFGEDGAEFDKGALPSSMRTDKDGRFRAFGLVPGLKYTLTAWKGSRFAGRVATDTIIRAGEVKELGDITAAD